MQTQKAPKFGHLLFLLITAISSFPFAAVGGGTTPGHLTCEHQKNPQGIDAVRPRLSWMMEPGQAPARGQRQTAYQILAASSAAILVKGQGDLWNSGKVESDKSVLVPYSGKPLASGQEVWWKVRVWDNGGKPSPWSETAHWSIGLLKPSDWQGKWIGYDSGEGKGDQLRKARWIWSQESEPGTRYFRRTITIAQDKPFSDAVIYFISTGHSTFYVNGKQYGTKEGIQDPFSTDITQALRVGSNTVAIAETSVDDGPAGIIGSIELDLLSGRTESWNTDGEWRVSGAETADWMKSDFNDVSWAKVRDLGAYGIAPWGEAGSLERRVLPARMLRKEFKVTNRAKRATLYISGLGLSEPYLNGSKVTDDVLSPALSDYEKRVYYRTYDVTPRVRLGENALGVILGNGRFFAPRHQIPTFTRTFGYPKLLLQLEIEYANGKQERVTSDESWKLTTEGPIRANNEYDGEVYDARKEFAGWSNPGFNDSAWEEAREVGPPAGMLSGQMCEPIRVTENLKPIRMTQPRPGVYLYDMGQNMVGWCQLKVSGPRGTRVSMRHAERLRGDGNLYTDNLRSARAQDEYILKGNGTEIYEPRFTYHGFRYVEVKGYPGKPDLSSLVGREVRDAVEQYTPIATSNPLINRIYKAIVWGAKDNYRSIPTDCPQRDERQGWLGDRSAESRGEFFLFDVGALYAKWMDDIGDSQDSKGAISDVAPAYWPLYTDNVTWPASFIIIPGHLYDLYGDLGLIEKHYPEMKKWFTHMQVYLKDDLMPRDSYGDWCVPPESAEIIISNDPARKTDGNLIGTAYYYHLLRLMTRYATLLGKKDDAESFGKLAEWVGVAFNKTYYNPSEGLYGNGSQTSSVLPLAFGLVPEQDREKVSSALLRKIGEQNKGHVGTGLIGEQFLMSVLTIGGHADVAYEIASQHDYPSWGYMLGKGATTIWELWNGDTANPAMNSGNHLMLVGDLITWFYENLAGIRPDPDQPGFKHVIMKPTLAGDLTFINASHQSPYGRIVSNWKRENGRFIWDVSLPPNTTATAYVPFKKGHESVLESGLLAEKAPGVKFLRLEAGSAVYELGSGNYHFTSPLEH